MMGVNQRFAVVVYLMLCCATFISPTSYGKGFVVAEDIVVCSTKQQLTAPSAFTGKDCRAAKAVDIDPQNQQIWVKAVINIPDKMLLNDQPYGFYLSGKTTSSVIFNGRFLGQNGLPGASKTTEKPGKMDMIFYVPPNLLQPRNEVILQLSAHYSFITLTNPISFIGMGPYVDPGYLMREQLWLSVVPLGALILGTLYFFVASLNPIQGRSNWLFVVMGLLAIGQLLAEISRALFEYHYSFHDFRLLLIIGCSMGFGVCLWVYMVGQFADKRHNWWIGGGVLMILLAVWLTEGFDGKTATAILIPALLSALLTAFGAIRGGRKPLWIYSAVFVLFSLTIVLTFGVFHDSFFYYLITAVLCFLFARQALEFSHEQVKRQAEEQEVAKLQFRLEQIRLEQNTEQQTPDKIDISGSGKIERISINLIAYCKAAGDYVEIYLADDQQRLYSGHLKDLEGQFPSTFMRVHRSYIVNTNVIISLEKSSPSRQKTPAGGGILVLEGGYEVPVSRRIMPAVRNVFN